MSSSSDPWKFGRQLFFTLFGLVFLVCAGFVVHLLFNPVIDRRASFVIKDTNLTKVDLNSFKGCRWNNGIDVLPGKFSFGIVHRDDYYLVSGMKSRFDFFEDNSEACGVLETDLFLAGQCSDLKLTKVSRPATIRLYQSQK